VASDLHSRSELLRYYYTECLAHAAAVLTILLVGANSIEKLLYLYRISVWHMPVALFLINVLWWIGIYLGVRTFYWGYMAHEIVYVSPLENENLSIYQDRAYANLMNSENRWARLLGQVANVKKWWIAYFLSSCVLGLISALLMWFGLDLMAVIILVAVTVPAVAYLSRFWRQLGRS